jgi:hypothetical protein
MKNKAIIISILIILTITPITPVIATQEAAPDWNTINYGIIEHENMPLYGESLTPNYVTIDHAGIGEVHILTKEQWKEVWGRIIKWKDRNGGTWPKYVDISMYHVGVNKIHKETYDNMNARWEQWINSHNGQAPNTIEIEDKIAINVINQFSNIGPIQKKLMDAVGPFNTFTGFYNLCKGRNYAYYLNHKFSCDISIKRLKNREGLNCVDASLLGYTLAKEMGYEVKFQESYCRVDNVGHVLLKVKGKELGGDWVIVDLAACISVNSRASLGHYWCSTPHDARINWARYAELK